MTKAYNWVRLDTAFARNDKVLALAGANDWRAISVFCFGLGHCREQKTAGFISKAALGFIHARPRDAEALVDVGLWEPAGDAGWRVHDWESYQETDDEMRARSDKAQHAAQVRWSKKVAQNGHTFDA